jgi:Domain of unknown function (DUF4156)
VIAMLMVLLLMLPLAGCVSLAPQGAQVSVIRNPLDVQACQKVGYQISSSSGWGGAFSGVGQENNDADIRNQTAQLGGDTFLILREDTGGFMAHPSILGQPYRCAEAAPSKPIGGTEAPPWCKGEKDTWDGHRCMTRN